jgi:5'-methylthioadenosine phosphorylase
MRALADSGVSRVLSTAAVGSLRPELRPGDIAVVEDFIDFTKRREFTVFDSPREKVVHVDFSKPYCPELTDALRLGAESAKVSIGAGVTYLCVEGPRYESPAEVRMFARWGGDVVGMTGVPEVVLAGEMNLCYGSLAIVTNYAAGISEHPLSHQEVLQCMAERSQSILHILEKAVSAIQGECSYCGK